MTEPVKLPASDASVEQRLMLRNFRERTYLSDEQAPYHGVSHPDAVWEKAKILIERCEQHGIPVDGEALRNAIDTHDALSHIPPRLLGFDSAERVAAVLTYHFLLGCGYSEAAARKSSDIVMATNPDVRPTTPEEIIIRAADLWNIGSHYHEFKAASLALHREAMNTARLELPFHSWIRGSFAYVAKFLWPMLELTPECRDAQGRSTWHTNAIRNLSTLWRETFGKRAPVIAEFFPHGDSTPTIPAQAFYIAVQPEEHVRRGSLGALASAAAAQQGAAFTVPGERGAFPIPDETCDRVICHEPSFDSLREALRVTRRGGVISLDFHENLDPRVLEVAKLFPFAISDLSSESKGLRTLVIHKELFV
jgi:hypothetical protein